MKLLLCYAGILLRSQMQYKTSFFFTTLGQFLVSFSSFLGIFFLFDRFSSVEGFTYQEVLLCFAAILLSFSLSECFFRGFDTFSAVLSNGEFDRIMVRPRNEMLQVLGARMDYTRIGRSLQAILIFAYAIPVSGLKWNVLNILTLVLMIIGGIALFVGLFILCAALCFFLLERLEFLNIFTDGSREFGRYPFSVYGEGILKFYTFIIPVACIQYYPLMHLIGRDVPDWYCLLPMAGFLFLVPCCILWKIGVKYFKSTGS